MLLLYAIFAYLCGALPLSVWVGRLALRQDIRAVGDGNPGAFNVLRAGGPGWFFLAMLLDFLKGAIPVGLATFALHFEGAGLAVIALAPMLGHATGPFLGFKGGKALAVAFGCWAGLSLFVVPILLGIAFGVWMYVLRSDGWAVIAGQFCLLVALPLVNPDPVWMLMWAGSTLIFLWKHWSLLQQPPGLRWYAPKTASEK